MMRVPESLGKFNDWKYFSILEEKSEKILDDEKKIKEEEEKEGLEVIDKLEDNLSQFKSAAGDKILKYKEFWDETKEASDSFDEEGDLYKLWDSDYIAGVLPLPDEALSDEVLDAEIEAVDKEEGDNKSEDEEETEEMEDDAEEDEDEDKDEDEKEDKEGEEELEEGNAFGNALRKAKKAGKKEFKVGGKTYPVKEEAIINELPPLNEDLDEDEDWERPKGEKFLLEKDEPELGFDLPAPAGKEEEETEDTEVEDTEGEEMESKDTEEEETESEEDEDMGIEAEGDAELGFEDEPEIRDFFVIYDISGKDHKEVFKTDSPKVIDRFNDFYQNQFKAAIKDQIQRFKEAQEEKRKAEELKAREEIRKARKSRLDKFMKDS